MRTDRTPSTFDKASADEEVRRILLIRNDNIGDLVCSIPAIQLFRKSFPNAEIDLLVNSYNAPVVRPLVPGWVNRLVIYQKTKHIGLSLGQMRHLWKFYSGLRAAHYDMTVLLVGGFSRQSFSFAKCTKAPRVIGYDLPDGKIPFKEGSHEVDYSWRLACAACGMQSLPPEEIHYPLRATGSRVALQITSRKAGNRWEAEAFAELIRRMATGGKQKLILLWSPGNATTPTHPGDDEKASEILRRVPSLVDPRPTATIGELLDVLKECRTLVTPDGGAMHLGAAMGLRVVAMFGSSDPVRWRPWTPRAKVLQSPTRSISDISVDEVYQGFLALDS